MKKTLIFFCKLIAGGLIALAALSLFCIFYDNPPISVPQPYALSNYHFKPNSFWSAMTEGFGYGFTNNIGYNTASDIDPTEPCIVFMGSSQTEAFQVPQDKSYVSLIEKSLMGDDDAANDVKCANIGISVHYFENCISNLEATAKYFENARYIVIETRSLKFTEEELDGMLTNAYYQPVTSHHPLYYVVWSIPFTRSLAKQYSRAEANNAATSGGYEIDYGVYAEKIERVMIKIASIAETHGFKPIIMYHNPIEAGDNCTAYRCDDATLLEIFTDSCVRNNIHFVDVTDRFVSHYEAACELPYGFSNTQFGSGHLNTTGHRIISEAMYERISALAKD